MPRLGYAVAALALVVATTALGVAVASRPDPEAAVAGPAVAPVRGPAFAGDRAARPGPGVGVLREWDRRRAAAWAAGDPRALRRLYTPGSRTGARDVRMLRAYAARGLRVRGLCTQLLTVRVVERRPQRLRLAVTERLCGGRVVGHGLVRRLPVDGADRRLVELVRAGDAWLVDEVRNRGRPRSPRGRRRRGTCSRPGAARPARCGSS